MSIQRNASAVKSPWQVDRWIWSRCSAKSTLLLFLIPIALALAASHVLPQIPAHLRSDPIGYQERLSAIQVQFRNWTPFLEAIGAFYIEDTLWFRFLLAVLAFMLLIAFGSEVSDLLALQPIGQPDEFYRSAGAISMSGSLSRDQAVEAVEQTLKTYARHLRRETHKDRVYLYGGRAGWTRAGMAVVYLGLLFLVGGLAANGQWGWQQPDVQVPPNELILTGPEGNHPVRLVDVKTDPIETLEIEVDGSQRLSLKWDAFGRRGGFRYQWASKGGPFVQVRAQRTNGRGLVLYNYEPGPTPEETLRFAFSPQAPQQEADRLFIVSEDKVVGRLAWLNKDGGNGDRPRFYLWTFGEDGRTPLGEQEFAQPEHEASGNMLTAQIGDVTYTLEVTRYVVLDVAYQPGWWALGIGVILLVAGLSIVLIPRRQTWALVVHQGNGAEVRLRDQGWALVRRHREQEDQMFAQWRAQLGGDESTQVYRKHTVENERNQGYRIK
jgi:hypothetical protein